MKPSQAAAKKPEGIKASSFRQAVFWMHLIAGVTAGTVIFIMSVTGVILAFEPQLVEFAEKNVRSVKVPEGAVRKNLDDLFTQARLHHPEAALKSVVVRSDPRSSVMFSFGKDEAVFTNPYTGEVLGGGSKLNKILHVVEDVHRWLGSRETGRPVTGACNLAFLFLVVSGFYLWWPRDITWTKVKSVIFFNFRLKEKACDWNRHNTAGFWSFPFLFIITLSGAVMSYGWANNLLYRLTGNEPPARLERPAAEPGGKKQKGLSETGESGGEKSASLQLFYGQALRHAAPGWVSMNFRMPAKNGAPVKVMIEERRPPHPKPRSHLTLQAADAEILKWEPFGEQNLGRKLRLWARYLHTGEAGGIPGQGIAMLASAGGALLVWTGLSLAWRRFYVKKGNGKKEKI